MFRLLYLAIFRESQCFKTYTAFLFIFLIRRWYNITIIRHQLDPDRPVSAAPNSPFKGLPSPHRPIALQFSTVLAVLLLSFHVTCRSQFDLHLLIFLSTGSTFNSSKIFSFLLWSKSVHRLFF